MSDDCLKDLIDAADKYDAEVIITNVQPIRMGDYVHYRCPHLLNYWIMPTHSSTDTFDQYSQSIKKGAM